MARTSASRTSASNDTGNCMNGYWSFMIAGCRLLPVRGAGSAGKVPAVAGRCPPALDIGKLRRAAPRAPMTDDAERTTNARRRPAGAIERPRRTPIRRSSTWSARAGWLSSSTSRHTGLRASSMTGSSVRRTQGAWLPVDRVLQAARAASTDPAAAALHLSHRACRLDAGEPPARRDGQRSCRCGSLAAAHARRGTRTSSISRSR